ncbi:MAG: hypothetical protein ACIARR_08030 [Phycisphaerales bacterium JB059]
MNGAWSGRELVEIAAQTLRDRDAALREEQAVFGLDAMDEVALHPVLGAGFRGAGLGVHPEQVYAGSVEARAARRERERCDLVLAGDPEARLLDPVAELVEIDRASGTLFEPVAETMVPEGAVVEPGEAYWLEVKAVAQVAYVSGTPGPNRAYASQLVGGPGADIVKLAREPTIRHGGAMVILFAQDVETGEHDIAQMFHALLDRDLPISETVWEGFEIEDRAGNGACVVALAGVRL